MKEIADPIWPTGYALNGKISCAGIKDMLEDLTKNTWHNELIEFDLNNEYIQGAALSGIKTIYELLSILNISLNYKFYEDNGKLVITNKKTKKYSDIANYKNAVIGDAFSSCSYTKISNIRVNFINNTEDYNMDYCDNFSGEDGEDLNIYLPIVINKSFATKIAANIYQKYQTGNYKYQINLPANFNEDSVFGQRMIKDPDAKLSRKDFLANGAVQLIFTGNSN